MSATEAASQAIITEPAWQRERRQMLMACYQEGRQDESYTGSLSEDRDRHIEQFKAEMASARQSRDVGRQAVIQSQYKTYRRDWIHRAVSHSCFAFCEAWCRLPKRL